MATTEQFSLRWNNFQSNMISGFHQLLETADMVDVTLAVEGHLLQAHKLVLSICSPYFKQMFKINPCKHPIIIMKDVGHDNMKNILEFMYMGEVSVLRENLSSFLRTAELLQVKGLTGDDSSETSSRKDDKLDCDMEEDDFNQLIESDVDLPHHYSVPRLSPQATATSQSAATSIVKRPNKNGPSNSKRLKSENTANQNKKSATHNLDSQESVNIKNETNDTPEYKSSVNFDKLTTDIDESTKESMNKIWENNVPPSTDQNNSENGKPWLNLTKSFKFNKQSYQCEKCRKKFSRRDHLRTHEKNIHGEDAGPFVCAICSQLYKNTESLRKHIAKFHFPKEANTTTMQKVEEIKVEN